MEKRKEKNIILKCAADFFFPIILVYGLYIILHGNSSPGGGFQGGVLVASVIVLFFLGHGWDMVKKLFHHEKLHWGENLAEALYVIIAAAALVVGVGFATNLISANGFYPFESAMLMNDAVGLDVMTGVGCLFLLLLGTLRPEPDSEEEEE